jgi:hypothetical protein
LACFLKFQVHSFHGKGAAMNGIRVFDAGAVQRLQLLSAAQQAEVISAEPSDLNSIVIDSIEELNRVETFFAEYVAALALGVDEAFESRVFLQAVRAFHRYLVSCYHLMVAGSSASSSFAKTALDFQLVFKTQLLDQLKRERLF